MDKSTLDAFFAYVDGRLQTDHGDTERFRDSAVKMAASFVAGSREALRARIIETCLNARLDTGLDTGLLNCPADTFTTKLRGTIEEVLDGE